MLPPPQGRFNDSLHKEGTVESHPWFYLCWVVRVSFSVYFGQICYGFMKDTSIVFSVKLFLSQRSCYIGNQFSSPSLHQRLVEKVDSTIPLLSRISRFWKLSRIRNICVSIWQHKQPPALSDAQPLCDVLKASSGRVCWPRATSQLTHQFVFRALFPSCCHRNVNNKAFGCSMKLFPLTVK